MKWRGSVLGVSVGVLGLACLITALIGGLPIASAQTETKQQEQALTSLSQTVSKIQLPKIEQPTWLTKQLAKEAADAKSAKAAGAVRASGKGMTVTYDTATSGAVTASFSEFQAMANQTLNDSRGWARMNVQFKQVSSGGQFTLVLAEASRLPSYSSGCSADYSCRAGRYVIINQDRWQGATPSWNSAGGSLRDYRHMVVNHETGHWLGHGHANCGGTGGPAAVMQQQSIDLQGCSFNPWPLASELNSPTLGLN